MARLKIQPGPWWGARPYEGALDLLETMEDRLSTRKSVPLKRFLVVPVYLVFRGLEQMLLNYGRTYFLAFALSILALWLAPLFPPEYRGGVERIALLSNFIAAAALIFAAPSTYCSSGTNAKHVGTGRDRLSELRINTKDKIELTLKNILLFEGRTRRRIEIFRWVLGAGWALYFTPSIATAIQQRTSGTTTLPSDLLIALAFLIPLYVLVEAYARGVDILFRAIELGCNEKLSEVIQLPQPPGAHG